MNMLLADFQLHHLWPHIRHDIRIISVQLCYSKYEYSHLRLFRNKYVFMRHMPQQCKVVPHKSQRLGVVAAGALNKRKVEVARPYLYLALSNAIWEKPQHGRIMFDAYLSLLNTWFRRLQRVDGHYHSLRHLYVKWLVAMCMDGSMHSLGSHNHSPYCYCS